MSTESENEQKGQAVLDKIYGYAMKGLPTSKPADELAKEYLSKHNGNIQKALDALITNQVAKCTTTGFLTGLGGVITLPVTLPADITSSMYVQMRMIAAIAVMHGYRLHDDAVKTMVYSVLLNIELGNILKQIGVKTVDKVAVNMLKKLPGKVLTKINQKLGFRFITKFGQKGIINIAKGIPFLGGGVNAVLNLAETKAIADRAVKAFSS
ncbi:MAG: EcsC family protein [Oscillospiraceae bacterium]|nr:EcsC family protein [Oscillospiraceae bacterium]